MAEQRGGDLFHKFDQNRRRDGLFRKLHPRLEQSHVLNDKKLLNDLVGRVFCGDDTNFLSLTKVEDLRVHSGENNLDSCKQFQIKDGEHCKIMIVKFYDKLLDLVAREGTHQVGSRMATVLGSSHKLSVFNKRLSSSQYTGLSRLEVSICEEALMRYKIW